MMDQQVENLRKDVMQELKEIKSEIKVLVEAIGLRVSRLEIEFAQCREHSRTIEELRKPAKETLRGYVYWFVTFVLAFVLAKVFGHVFL